MRFFATYRLAQQPRVTGCTRESKYETYLKQSCHEFSVRDVTVDVNEMKYYSVAAAHVTLAAGKSSEDFLYGPASLKKDRTLIYPCEKNRCRLGCPCHLCRKRVNNCLKAGNRETCGDCVECRADCDDHLLFHRAAHLNCKFCLNMLDHIPNLSPVIRHVRGYLPDLYEECLSASLFEHCYNEIDPVQDFSSKFSCDKCDKQFERKSDLKRHEFSIHYGKKHFCRYCAMQFSRDDTLWEHVKLIHWKKEMPKFQCEVCKDTFQKKANLNQHVKTSSVCELCFTVFCTEKQLQLHKKSSHLASHSCDACKKCFKEKSSLKRHLEGRHKVDGSWKNFCGICNIGFCSLQDLLRHNRSHPKKCDHCGKTFSSNRNLSVHLAKREDILCTECGIMLCNEYDLRVHTNSVHNVKQCKLCLKIFCIDSFKHHMYAEHQKLVDLYE